jgi:hypothetical protein
MLLLQCTIRISGCSPSRASINYLPVCRTAPFECKKACSNDHQPVVGVGVPTRWYDVGQAATKAHVLWLLEAVNAEVAGPVPTEFQATNDTDDPISA